MEIYVKVGYFISILISILIIIAVSITCLTYRPSFQALPKALRFFIVFWYIPMVFIVATLTLCYSITFMFFDARNVVIFFNLVIPFTTQMMRSIFLTIILERIFATVFLRIYNLANKTWFFGILVAATLMLSFGFSAFFESKSISTDGSALNLLAFTILGMHAVIFVTFALLYFLHKRNFKVTVYRTTLKRRHQIFENVKVLSFLFPSIFIFTLIAPWGSIFMSAGYSFQLPPIPLCVYHIFHNLPHLFICLRLKFKFNRISHSNSASNNDENLIRNAMGRNISSTYATTDQYFMGLKEQWNK